MLHTFKPKNTNATNCGLPVFRYDGCYEHCHLPETLFRLTSGNNKASNTKLTFCLIQGRQDQYSVGEPARLSALIGKKAPADYQALFGYSDSCHLQLSAYNISKKGD